MNPTDTLTLNAQAFIDRYIINRRDNTRPIVMNITNAFDKSLIEQLITLDTEIITTIHNPLVRIGEQLTIETRLQSPHLRFVWLTHSYHGYLASTERDNELKKQSAIDRQLAHEHRYILTSIVARLKVVFPIKDSKWLDTKDGQAALIDFATTLLDMPESTPKTAILSAAKINIEELRTFARK